RLSFIDTDGNDRLIVDVDRNGEPAIRLSGTPDSGLLLIAGPYKKYGPAIFLSDTKSVIEISQIETDRPSIRIQDKDGFLAKLGSADLVTAGTGETGKTSAASMILFGKDGKVIWKAP